MKKAAFFIIVFTVSRSLFACWGGSRSEFWDDGMRKTIAPILIEVTQVKPNDLKLVAISSASSYSWTAFMQYIKVSYLANLLPKH